MTDLETQIVELAKVYLINRPPALDAFKEALRETLRGRWGRELGGKIGDLGQL